MERINIPTLKIDEEENKAYIESVKTALYNDFEALEELENIFKEFESYGITLTDEEKESIILKDIHTIHQRLRKYTDESKRFVYKLNYDFRGMFLTLGIKFVNTEERKFSIRKRFKFSSYDIDEMINSYDEVMKESNRESNYYKSLKNLFTYLTNNNVNLIMSGSARYQLIQLLSIRFALNKSVSIIDASKFFNKLDLYKQDDQTEELMNKIESSEYLFIDDLDHIPTYNKGFLERFVIPILNNRMKKQKKTIISSCSKDKLIDTIASGKQKDILKELLENYKEVNL